MPRKPRYATFAPGDPVHLISRLVDGRFLFDDEARAAYLVRLERAIGRSDWRLFSYALMSSHVHLGLLAGAMPLASWVHPLHVAIAQWVNRRSRSVEPRTRGHVFAERPSTIAHHGTSALALVAYQHGNPVRAGVVQNPSESTWTSHRAYVGLEVPPRCLDVSLGLRLCGYGDSPAYRNAFHDAVVCFVSASSEASRQTRLTAPAGAACVPNTNDDSGVRSSATPTTVLEYAAAARGVATTALRSQSRVRSVVAARRIALEAWERVGGSAGTMSRELGITRGAASQLLRRGKRTPAHEQAVAVVVAQLRN